MTSSRISVRSRARRRRGRGAYRSAAEVMSGSTPTLPPRSDCWCRLSPGGSVKWGVFAPEDLQWGEFQILRFGTSVEGGVDRLETRIAPGDGEELDASSC